jgi:hypothetical protein
MRAAILSLVVCISIGTASRAQDMANETALVINQSKIASAGSLPFHLKAVLKEPSKKDSSYRAEIEEYWAAPTK